MKCVPAENDVLTDKTYYPGTYYHGCIVLRALRLTHDEIHLQGTGKQGDIFRNGAKLQVDGVEPVRPYVSVGADDPDVGEALALLAQFGHAGDVRVVARQELHPRRGHHGRGGGGGGGSHLDLRGVPLDVHQRGHGRDEMGRELARGKVK